MTASPSTPLRAAHSRHSRSTARVESAKTPSRSKRMAEQEKVGIYQYLNTVIRSISEQQQLRCHPEQSEGPVQLADSIPLSAGYMGPSLRSELVTFLVRFIVAQSYK